MYMKKQLIYVIIVITASYSLLSGRQLFGERKSKSKSRAISSSASAAGDQDEPFIEQSVPTVRSRKNIESVIPVKRIPQGWIFRGELLAPWEANLPAVLSVIPDTTLEVIYQDDSRTTNDGIVIPIKRASVEFQYSSRLTVEQIILEFTNVDFIYSTTNNNDSHYLLSAITKKVGLKDTGFPQLTADDIIKHKVLMEYGTPKEFDGVWHIYQEPLSTFRARELDERNLKVEMISTNVEKRINKAVEDMYSKQGIEYKKRLMIQGIDL